MYYMSEIIPSTESTIKDKSDLEKRTGQMSATDKHLILLTGADRHNDNLVVGCSQ